MPENFVFQFIRNKAIFNKTINTCSKQNFEQIADNADHTDLAPETPWLNC